MRYIVFVWISLVSLLAGAQHRAFDVVIEEYEISNAPGVQSFVWGLDGEGRWVIIGGRTDGLHQRQPFAAFLASANNTSIYLVDPNSKQVWSASLSGLSSKLVEQFQSTNMQFYQKDSFLYIIGGYGYSSTAMDHITYPYLSRLNVNEVSRNILDGTSFSSAILQIENASFAVTGGHLGFMNDTFYLAGGQNFEGRYNPMGPDHGPGFIQEYTDEIRIFTLNETNSSVSLDQITAWNDAELHRRDYNMLPQIFADGSKGFTMFSGVFRADLDLPHLNMVDFDHNGFTVNNDFNQLLSQYHSAKFPLYDSAYQTMHSIFFGGMSQFTLDQDGELVEDQDVPFVKTISRMTRFANDSMAEVELPIKMPAFLGAGAEFIPTGSQAWYDHEVLILDRLPQEKTLIGYIYGGIESTAENIFFVNDGSQSDASNGIFKVYLTSSSTIGIEDKALTKDAIIDLEVSPNPSTDKLVHITFNNLQYAKGQLSVHDLNGRVIKSYPIAPQAALKHAKSLDLRHLEAGTYIVALQLDQYSIRKKIVIQ